LLIELPIWQSAISNQKSAIEKMSPHIDGVPLTELADERPRTFVDRFRQHQADLEHEIAAAAGGIGQSEARNAQPLACVRAWRNAKLHRSLERRDVDAPTQHRFVHGNRKDTDEIVTGTLENRVRLDVDGHEQVAGTATVSSGVSALRDANPSAVGHARRHPHGDALAANDAALPDADGAPLAAMAPHAPACFTGLGEHHVATGPSDLTPTLTIPAPLFGRRDFSLTRAGTAQHLPSDDDLALDAVHGVREPHRQRHVEIRARFGTSRTRRLARMQQIGKELAERRRLRALMRD
jgi:hypothetical protein